jgi:hypothetical protein
MEGSREGEDWREADREMNEENQGGRKWREAWRE